MHEYLQKYKPLRILESIVLRQTCEIDFIVKKHMKCYGIDNVRGGSYTAITLTDDEKKFIQREHLMTIDKMETKCAAMATVFNEYKDIRTWPLDKINTEMSLVTRQQSLYDNEKGMLNKLSIGKNNIQTNRIFLTDLRWLLNQSVKNMKESADSITPGRVYYASKDVATKYKQILNKMKALYAIFCEHIDVEIKYEPRIHLYAPETLLDVFLYHCHQLRHWETYMVQLINLCEYYEYIFYCVITRIDEYKFDVNTYPLDFEFTNRYRITYLQKWIDSNDSRGIV
jgi:GTPase SAR1 family protein